MSLRFVTRSHGLEKLGIVTEMRTINRKRRGQVSILTEDSPTAVSLRWARLNLQCSPSHSRLRLGLRLLSLCVLLCTDVGPRALSLQ